MIKLNENQTLAEETTDLAILEDIIKRDPLRHCCDRCVHGDTGWCDRHVNHDRYYECFRFNYAYWRKILIAREKYENILKEFFSKKRGTV